MGYFEFPNGSRIIWLPLNISEKLHRQHLFENLEEAEIHCLYLYLLIWYNTPYTLNNKIYHSHKWEPPPFVHLDTNTLSRFGPFRWQNPCSLCNSGTDLVVVLEYIFFNFVPTPNKSLRFTKLRRSYANHTAVAPTNHCQSYTDFLLGVRCSKWPHSFFCRCLSTLNFWYARWYIQIN